MGDLITLNCPSCGGKLEISGNSSILTCNHCGSEYIVRREAGAISLETFARCPCCGRNDKVEKVSAIIRSNTQRSMSFDLNHLAQSTYSGNGTDYFKHIQNEQTVTTNLAKSLEPPTKPKNILRPELEKEIDNDWFLRGYLIFVVFSLLSLFLYLIMQETNTFRIMSFLSLPIIGLFLVGIVWYKGFASRKKIEKKNEEIRKRNNTKVEQWRLKNQLSLVSWETAIDNWKRLYYCYRDDVVFIPGWGTYASVDQMEEYLSQECKE